MRVGNLNFEILIDPTLSGNKKPKIKDVADVAARTVDSKKKKPEGFDDSVSDWLAVADDSPIGDAATVQFSMDDLESILDYSARKKDSIEELKKSDSVDSALSTEEDIDEDDETKKKKKKKEFGKLPPLPKFSHDDSTSAAGDVLKKFFNRR